MLDIVTFKWKPAHSYRSSFTAEAVNVLAAMVRRNFRGAYRFSCITDDPAGLDPEIRPLPMFEEHASLVSTHGRQNPSCYRRLKLFSPEARELIGPRILSLDLDAVITGDVTGLWTRPDDFIAWEGTAGKNPYNGSMMMLTAGARPAVWADFNPARSPALARQAGFIGSDQAWIAYRLGSGEARWTRSDGVFSWRMHLRLKGGKLPPGARIVFFHGHADPWQATTQSRAPWICDHWRKGEANGDQVEFFPASPGHGYQD